MKTEIREARFLVVLNKETILGEFSEHEDAMLFAYISALHGESGDIYEVYGSLEGFEIA